MNREVVIPFLPKTLRRYFMAAFFASSSWAMRMVMLLLFPSFFATVATHSPTALSSVSGVEVEVEDGMLYLV